MVSPISAGIRNGVIAGLITVIITLILYFVNPSLILSGVSTALFVVVIILMVMAGLAVKRSNGGFLSFKDGFLSGFVTFAVYAIISGLFTYILYNFIGTDLADLTKEKTIEWSMKMFEMAGLPEDQMEDAITAIEESDTSMTIGKTVMGMFMNMLMGLIPAAIIGLIIRKKGEERPNYT